MARPLLSALSRRNFLTRIAGAAALATSLLAAPAVNAEPAKEFRIGWQKGGNLAVLKARGTLEKRLAADGVAVKWVEFPAGPQLLEGLNVGSVDFGLVGETPPVIAQAAGANLLYVGNEPPAPHGERLLVPKNSPIKTIADLKGKRIALNKGSNVHYLLVKALEKSGLAYSDVTVAYLTPADARAAFEAGSVDAWVIWEPFAAAAEAQIEARTLADATGIANNHIFYIATRPYAEKHPEVLKIALDELNATGKWIATNPKDAAAVIAPQLGLTEAIAQVAITRYAYGVKPLTEEVVKQQQQIADTFYDLKLIPKKLDVASVVWRVTN